MMTFEFFHSSLILWLIAYALGNEVFQDNSGREFVVMFLSSSRDGHPVRLSIATVSNSTAEVRVQTPNWISNNTVNATLSIYPGELRTFYISEEIRMENRIENKTVLVRSSADIILYATNVQCGLSDSTIIYPTETLGRQYATLSYYSAKSDNGRFGCIALYDLTNISVTPSKGKGPVGLGNKKYTYPDKMELTLMQYEAFQVYTYGGASTITADDKVACFSGSSFQSISCPVQNPGKLAFDHMYVQLVPVELWSYEYIIFNNPNLFSEAGDWIQIVAFYDNTIIKILLSHSGECRTHQIDQSTSYESFVKAGQSALVISNKRILIGQFSCYSSLGTVESDARLFISLSTQHFLPQYTFVIPDISGFKALFQYGLVIIAETYIRKFLILDDMDLHGSVIWTEAERLGYSYTSLSLNSGTHRLDSKTFGKFGGYIYGYVHKSEFGTVIGRKLSRSSNIPDKVQQFLKERWYGVACVRAWGRLMHIFSTSLMKLLSRFHFNFAGSIHFKALSQLPITIPASIQDQAAMFEIVDIDKQPYADEMIRLDDVFKLSCFMACIKYVNCAVVAYSKEEGVCLLYGNNAVCTFTTKRDGYMMYLRK